MLKGLKWQVVIITIVVVLSLLLGGFNLYQNTILPVKISKDLSTVKYVESSKVEIGNNGYVANIKLDKTDNILKTYEDIQKSISKYSANIKIKIIDNTDSKLNNIYYKDQFAIYQAIQNGDYINMSDIIYRNGKSQGVKSFIYIDVNNVYLSIIDGQHYLYKIIPRNLAKGGKLNG